MAISVPLGLDLRYDHMKQILLLCVLGLISCKNSEKVIPEGSLQAYLNESRQPISKQLIACAASFPMDNTDEFENAIFFLPTEESNGFKYFESPMVDLDPDNLAEYQEVELPLEPVFNFLKKFTRPAVTDEKWGKVVYVSGDSIHVCNAIRLKQPIKPTEINSDLLEMKRLENGQIQFNWQDGIYPENAIYFQVISDSSGQLLTGTYTYDRHFTLFDMSNVVLNINPDAPIPELQKGDSYTFTLMAVSLDNWVNLICTRNFQY